MGIYELLTKWLP